VVSTIDRRAVEYLLEQDGQLVDVLGAEAYEKEHIAGAVNLPLATLAQRATRLDLNRPVIVYCFDSL
jgi:rhodanese-related sulfurtransferase